MHIIEVHESIISLHYPENDRLISDSWRKGLLLRYFLYHCQWQRPLWPWIHDDIIKWKHFPRYWPFVRGINISPVNSPHKGQWRGALIFSLICAWINGWVNSRKAGDLKRHRAHHDFTLMYTHVWYVTLSKDNHKSFITSWCRIIQGIGRVRWKIWRR